MARRDSLRKSLALISGVALVAAFVLYRSGIGASSMSGSKSTFMFVGSSITPPGPSVGGQQAPANPAESQAGRLNPFVPVPPGE